MIRSGVDLSDDWKKEMRLQKNKGRSRRTEEEEEDVEGRRFVII